MKWQPRPEEGIAGKIKNKMITPLVKNNLPDRARRLIVAIGAAGRSLDSKRPNNKGMRNVAIQYLKNKGRLVSEDSKVVKSVNMKRQLRMGRKVEHEHTKGLPPKEANLVADKIAHDHVSEFPDYYTRLKTMEKKAKKDWNIKENLHTAIGKAETISRLAKRATKAYYFASPKNSVGKTVGYALGAYGAIGAGFLMHPAVGAGLAAASELGGLVNAARVVKNDLSHITKMTLQSGKRNNKNSYLHSSSSDRIKKLLDYVRDKVKNKLPRNPV